MNSIDFCYWLQGYFEISEETPQLSPKQIEIIKNHLNLVFKHEIDDMYPGDKQELQEIHDGKPNLFPDYPGYGPIPGKNDTLIRC